MNKTIEWQVQATDAELEPNRLANRATKQICNCKNHRKRENVGKSALKPIEIYKPFGNRFRQDLGHFFYSFSFPLFSSLSPIHFVNVIFVYAVFRPEHLFTAWNADNCLLKFGLQVVRLHCGKPTTNLAQTISLPLSFTHFFPLPFAGSGRTFELFHVHSLKQSIPLNI